MCQRHDTRILLARLAEPRAASAARGVSEQQVSSAAAFPSHPSVVSWQVAVPSSQAAESRAAFAPVVAAGAALYVAAGLSFRAEPEVAAAGAALSVAAEPSFRAEPEVAAAGAALYVAAEPSFRVEPEVAVERAARSSVVQRASRSGVGSLGWAE